MSRGSRQLLEESTTVYVPPNSEAPDDSKMRRRRARSPKDAPGDRHQVLAPTILRSQQPPINDLMQARLASEDQQETERNP